MRLLWQISTNIFLKAAVYAIKKIYLSERGAGIERIFKGVITLPAIGCKRAAPICIRQAFLKWRGKRRRGGRGRKKKNEEIVKEEDEKDDEEEVDEKITRIGRPWWSV